MREEKLVGGLGGKESMFATIEITGRTTEGYLKGTSE